MQTLLPVVACREAPTPRPPSGNLNPLKAARKQGLSRLGHVRDTSSTDSNCNNRLAAVCSRLGEIRPSPCDIGLPAPDGHQVVLTFDKAILVEIQGSYAQAALPAYLHDHRSQERTMKCASCNRSPLLRCKVPWICTSGK